MITRVNIRKIIIIDIKILIMSKIIINLKVILIKLINNNNKQDNREYNNQDNRY